MSANFHTHTLLCDGSSTPEEVACAAIQKGFSAIGFSGHGYTDFDLSYCIKNMDEYIREIDRLKEKYKNQIQIYLGVEEDFFSPIKRSDFDYIIGSAHYILKDGRYYPVDLSTEGFDRCLEVFGGNYLALAEAYYRPFCDYIKSRKPDIIGHFDLITKYDEKNQLMLLSDKKYNLIAEKYISNAAEADCIFEVNTGAISRGLRTSPYPSENLLYVLKRLGCKIILSSDSHAADTLDFGFEETKKYLRDIGFRYAYTLYNNEFIKEDL